MKDPAFLFYSGDFLTGTQFFTDEQVGKYIRLMVAQHQHGRLNEKQMLHICKTYDSEIFEKFKFDGEFYFNERLENEVKKRKNYTESRRNNRIKKEEPIVAKDIKPKKIKKTYDLHMENENENENENINVLEIINTKSDEFKKTWNILVNEKNWKKKSKRALEMSLKKIVNLPDGQAVQVMNDTIAGGWKGLFIERINQAKGQITTDDKFRDAANEIINRIQNGVG